MPQADELAPSHAENFSLQDFFGVEGATLSERVGPFSRYYRSQIDAGRALYSRESQTPNRSASPSVAMPMCAFISRIFVRRSSSR